MYKTPDYEYEQLSFTSFNATCGMQLDPDNEWIRISKGISLFRSLPVRYRKCCQAV